MRQQRICIQICPASAPHGSEADGADWGFEEPVTEEAAAEPAEDEYLAADNAETLDASDEKSERTLSTSWTSMNWIGG